MNGYIASTITACTSSPATHRNAGTHFNADFQSCQSPEPWIFLPSVPGDWGRWWHQGGPLAGHPLSHPIPPCFHAPANGTGLSFTARRLEMANGFPHSASLGIISHGILWGDVSLGPLLSEPWVWLQVNYYIPSNHGSVQQGQRKAEGTNIFPTRLRRNLLQKNCRKPHGCLAAVLLISQ